MDIDANTLKQKIQSSPILSDSEKREWSYLLPIMTDDQKQDLLRILEVRMPLLTEKPKNQKTEEPKQEFPPSPGVERDEGRGRKNSVSTGG